MTLVSPSKEFLVPEAGCWTVDDFQRAYDLGVFGFDMRLELIEGELIRKMTQNSPHTTALHLTLEALRAAFTRGFYLRVQSPLVIGKHSRPEPDIAVVTGSVRDYQGSHPTTASLVVEISDSTLFEDRSIKAALYARAGIEDYWIVNLPDHVVEVHRQPIAIADQLPGYYYRSITRLTDTDTLSPLAAPDAIIAVSDLLP